MSARVIRRILLKASLLCTFFLCTLAHAEERILGYHSEIRIEADGSILVTETIRVRAEGVNIRRGLYRDFPTRYSDRLGNAYRVGFEIIQLTRDGRPEPWNAYRFGNGIRVDFGNDDFLSVPAEYEYALQYRTTRQLGFFADHDELYWNVTGNGWNFTIDETSATVTLPQQVPVADLAMEGYTGAFGGRGQDYVAELASGKATIRTTRTLAPRAGLTLVLSWPKGVIAEPTRLQKLGYLLEDNRTLLLALVTFLATAAWLTSAWMKVGRDPAAGVVFPHYAPPDGFSPAVARYISRMGYDNTALTASLVNLAVLGYIHITEENKKYVLRRNVSVQPLAADEKALYYKLFPDDRQELVLEKKSHTTISAAIAAHAMVVKQGGGQGKYFLNNSRYLLLSLLGSVVMFGVVLFLGAVPLAVFVFIAIMIMHIVFGFLLRAPTKAGRQVLDKLEGFKLYLDVAEKDEMNLRNPPQLTPELFERFLPFAIALGVEQAWAARFERALDMMQDRNRSGIAYHPLWYTGHFNPSRMTDFTSSVGNGFNSAISSAATPPGTSSGRSGGGFSGGGGGGGGGGGR